MKSEFPMCDRREYQLTGTKRTEIRFAYTVALHIGIKCIFNTNLHIEQNSK